MISIFTPENINDYTNLQQFENYSPDAIKALQKYFSKFKISPEPLRFNHLCQTFQNFELMTVFHELCNCIADTFHTFQQKMNTLYTDNRINKQDVENHQMLGLYQTELEKSQQIYTEYNLSLKTNDNSGSVALSKLLNFCNKGEYQLLMKSMSDKMSNKTTVFTIVYNGYPTANVTMMLKMLKIIAADMLKITQVVAICGVINEDDELGLQQTSKIPYFFYVALDNFFLLVNQSLETADTVIRVIAVTKFRKSFLEPRLKLADKFLNMAKQLNDFRSPVLTNVEHVLNITVKSCFSLRKT